MRNGANKRAFSKMLAAVDQAAAGGDLAIVINIPQLPELSRVSRQEELVHRFNNRSGLRQSFDTEMAAKQKGELGPGYSGAGVVMRVDEKFAKSLRDDADVELNISKRDVRENRRQYIRALIESGIDDDVIINELPKISRKGEGIARLYGKLRSGERQGRGPAVGREDESIARSDLRSLQDVSEGGLRQGVRYSRGFAGADADRLARLRQADLSGRGQTALSQALAPRNSDTPATTAQVQALRKAMPGADILFSLTDPPTSTEITFWTNWIKNRRETSLKQIVVNFRRAGLLTGFKTHLRNMASNAAFQASEEAARAIALMADLAASAVTGRRTVSGPSPTAILKGFRSLVFADETLRHLDQESGIARAWNILKNGSVEELRNVQT